MSRKPLRRGPRRGAGPAPPAQPSRPRARRTQIAWLALAVVALIAAGLWSWRAVRDRRPEGAAADSVAVMDPHAAYALAHSLLGQGRSHESLPYFRRAIGSPAGASDPSAHLNYANAMYNAVFELDTLAGRPLAVVTSSVDRVSLMREVLGEYTRAYELAPTPAQRARILNETARALQSWGFEWEALFTHRRAALADPSDAAYAREADAFMLAMRHPELARATAPGEFGGR